LEHDPELVCPCSSIHLAGRANPTFLLTAHKVFERGYDVIAAGLDEPPVRDLQNFLGYCDAWAQSIEHHHDSEVRRLLVVCGPRHDVRSRMPQEATVFPVLRKKMDIGLEEEQHRVLHDFLTRFTAVLRVGQKDPSAFDAAAAKKVLEEGKDNLVRGQACDTPSDDANWQNSSSIWTMNAGTSSPRS
jgi:hypothetical protein